MDSYNIPSRLAFEVIHMALKDLKGRDPEYRQQALNWIQDKELDPYISFKSACDVLQWGHERVAKGILVAYEKNELKKVISTLHKVYSLQNRKRTYKRTS